MSQFEGIESIDPKDFTHLRQGETKWGEVMAIVRDPKTLATEPARYILLGIPEDIGVRANGGRQGATEAWTQTLSTVCSLPAPPNEWSHDLALLGTVSCNDLQQASLGLNPGDPADQKIFHQLITELDDRVTIIIQTIVESGKIPIVIGGGHNNSFGLLKGASLATRQALNCLNIDTHADFRALEHRHSGNGFSYAVDQGHLNLYALLGLQNAMTSREILARIRAHHQQFYLVTYEALIDQEITFDKALQNTIDFVGASPFGLEIDLDVIAQMGSSAQSPSGLTLDQVRAALRRIKQQEHCQYVHLCEGAPEYGTSHQQVAKALALLIYDAVRP